MDVNALGASRFRRRQTFAGVKEGILRTVIQQLFCEIGCSS